MAEDHNGLNNGRLDESAYLQHCELVLAERERLMRFELDRFNEGFFFMLYDTPDRVQHMMWRFRDREHPGYDPDVSPELSTRIEEHYRRCDALLSAVLDKTDENSLLIVLSDHGFATFPGELLWEDSPTHCSKITSGAGAEITLSIRKACREFYS